MKANDIFGIKFQCICKLYDNEFNKTKRAYVDIVNYIENKDIMCIHNINFKKENCQLIMIMMNET